MKNTLIICMLALSGMFFTLSFCVNSEGMERVSNGFEWQKASPESQGVSSEKLEKARLLLAKRGTVALLVIRHDKIILEWYAKGWNKDKKHYTASLAKSIVGGMSLLAALNDGYIGIDDLACDYIPRWKDDPMKSKITIRMLAAHTSGIEDAEEDNLSHTELPGWKGRFWKRDPDPFSIARDHAPVIFQPGTRWAYSNPGFAMLAYAVTTSLKNAPLSDIYLILKERIMDPIGLTSDDYTISYGGNAWSVDNLKLYAIWGGGMYTARAVARVGRLMLHKGNWEGNQLIKPDWVERVTSYSGEPLPQRSEGNPRPGTALCWWSNFDGVLETLPRDTFIGVGAGHQVLLVVPGMDLIAVRFGSLLDREKGLLGLFDKYIYNRFLNSEEKHSFWGDAERYIFDPIIDAINK